MDGEEKKEQIWGYECHHSYLHREVQFCGLPPSVLLYRTEFELDVFLG